VSYVHFENGESPVSVTQSTISLPGWTVAGTTGNNHVGVFKTGNTVDCGGSIVLFFNSGGAYITQDLDWTITDATYNLTASVGGGNGSNDGGYIVSLYTHGGTLLAQVTAGDPGAPDTSVDPSNFKRVSLNFDARGSDQIGQKLQLRFQQSRDAQGHVHCMSLTEMH